MVWVGGLLYLCSKQFLITYSTVFFPIDLKHDFLWNFTLWIFCLVPLIYVHLFINKNNLKCYPFVIHFKTLTMMLFPLLCYCFYCVLMFVETSVVKILWGLCQGILSLETLCFSCHTSVFGAATNVRLQINFFVWSFGPHR